MASAAVLSLASTTHAAGDFQGFYVGANAGYANAKSDVDITARNEALDALNLQIKGSTIFPLASSGFTGGFQVGYNHQINNFVFGLELGFNFGSLKAHASTTLTVTPTTDIARDALNDLDGIDGAVTGQALNVTTPLSVKRSNEILVAARTGFIVNNWMPYVKVGLSNAKIELGAASERLNGFLVGVGVETVLSDHVVVGGEWTTASYKSKNNVDLDRTQEFKIRLQN